MDVSSVARAVAAAPMVGDESRAGRQFLRLSLRDEMYAVGIDRVREILEVSHITPLPLMPAFVRGVMNLRGAVVPVVDLGARLGLPPAELARRSCVVMVDVLGDEGQTAAMGMLVDAVFEVFDAAEAEQEPPPRFGTRVDPRHLRGMVRLRGTPTPELHLQSLLDAHILSELIAVSFADRQSWH